MEGIFTFFEKYGFMGILWLISIGLVWLLIKWLSGQIGDMFKTDIEKISTSLVNSMDTRNDKLIEHLQNMNDKFLDVVVSINTRPEISNAPYVNKLEDRMNVSKEVQDKLKDITLYNNSSRTAIIEFHNSNHSLVGVPFAKYSCTFEWFTPGEVPLTAKCQELPFASIVDVVDDIMKSENHQVVYSDISQISSPILNALLKGDLGCKAIIYTGMYDTQNKLIGLLALEFKSNIPEHVELRRLELDAAQIGSMINLRHKSGEDEKYNRPPIG